MFKVVCVFYGTSLENRLKLGRSLAETVYCIGIVINRKIASIYGDSLSIYT